MEEEGKAHFAKKPSPEIQASVPSLLTWHWMTPLVKLGNNKILQMEDLFDLIPDDTASQCEQLWKLAVLKAIDGDGNICIGKALFRCLGKSYFMAALWKVCWLTAVLLQVYIVKALVHAVEAETSIFNWPIGIKFVVAMLLAAVIQSIAQNNLLSACQRLSMRARSIICMAIYEKLLSMNVATSNEVVNMGTLLNLATNDTQKLVDAGGNFHYAWFSIVEILVLSSIMMREAGISALPGVLVVLSFQPLPIWMGWAVGNFRMRAISYTDMRMRLLGELLAGIRTVKFNGWTLPFVEKVAQIRNEELHWIRKASFLKLLTLALKDSVVPFAALSIFWSYGWLHGKLTASMSFSVLALLNVLARVFNFAPPGIQCAWEAVVAVQRLQMFLNVPSHNMSLQTSQSSTCISVVDGWFSWQRQNVSQEITPTLMDINMSIQTGQSIGITGAVGGGKSSLLLSLLREMMCLRGTLLIKTPVAYVPQQPWVFNGTICENILFGHEYNDSRYKEIMIACALDYDVKYLPAGDSTEIGERGVNLSGGQKARINLARACYSFSPVVLLDDPFSSIDSRIAKYLIQRVLQGILQDRTVVLVTHNIDALMVCDEVYTMHEGKLRSCILESLQQNSANAREHTGSAVNFEQCGQSMCGHLNDSLNCRGIIEHTDAQNVNICNQNADEPSSHDVNPSDSQKQSTENKNNFDQDYHLCQISPQCLPLVINTDNHQKIQMCYRGEHSCRYSYVNLPMMKMNLGHFNNSDFSDEEEKTENLNVSSQGDHPFNISTEKMPLAVNDANIWKFEKLSKRRTLTVKEDRIEGCVTWKTLVAYIQAGGCLSFVSVMLTFLFTQAARVMASYWLAIWTDEVYHLTLGVYVGVYTCIAIGATALSTLRAYTFSWVTNIAAKTMHRNMLWSIFNSPLGLFEQNLAGTILNRLGKDQACIDDLIPNASQGMLENLVGCIGSIVMITVLIPRFLLAIPLFMLFLLYFQRQYIAVSREIKRLDGVSRSPIFVHFTQTLEGLASIRAFGMEERFHKRLAHLIDENHRAYILFQHVSRWLSFRLDITAASCVMLTVLFVVIFHDEISPGIAGVVLVQSLQLTGLFQYGIRMAADIENNFVSVERVLAYSNLKQEFRLHTSKGLIPKDWPTKGEISFVDYTMAYRKDGPAVLQNISLKVRPQQKVGILGRTGAGKSSLVLALFQMVDNAACSGHIFIDGIDIMSIGVDDLRKRISIVPQDPFLFKETVRMNLDPFGQHTDDEIYEALSAAQLMNNVQQLKDGIYTVIGENGHGFSVGECQLFCLARAILRRSRILVMDEATSSVDPETEHKIQTVIQDAFKRCTVITIAHRIKALHNCDQIWLVRHGGRVLEFDGLASFFPYIKEGLDAWL